MSVTRAVGMRLAELGRAISYCAAQEAVKAWEARALSDRSTVPSRQIWLALAIIAAEKHETDASAVVGRSKEKRVCEARFEAWSRLREHGYSLPGIARAVKRHHTAVMFGLRRAAALPGKAGRPAVRVRA